MWNAGMHTNGRTEILPCALQDIVTFGAAALHKLQYSSSQDVYSRAEGIADHYWPWLVLEALA